MRFAAAVVMSLALAACSEKPAPQAAEGRALAADHHLHIRSSAMGDAAGRLCGAMADCDAERLKEAVTGADAVAALDEADASQGLVLSMGYFAGMPELEIPLEDQQALNRSENEYVAQEVARFPNRLSGFFSVNPLSDYAQDEVRYWIADGRLSGLKLHFTNSDVDLRNEDHVAKLSALFDILGEAGAPVFVHMRTRNMEYGAEDARAFIDKVLAPHPNVPAIVAHMASWGSYDAGADAALGAFAAAFEDGTLKRGDILFDMTAVTAREPAPEMYAALKARIDEIGPDLVVFGSDWDGGYLTQFSPLSEAEKLKAIGLDDETLTAILHNRAAFAFPG
jgi:predicted TIM-barrel fold metal-dependent hydrolase